MTNLNERQRKFAENIMKGMSQKQAYIEAGYNSEGQAAESNASRLIRNDKVQDYLEKRKGERLRAVNSQLSELTREAINTIIEIQRTDLSELNDQKRKALKLKFDSARDILDRVGISGKGDVEVNIANKVESKELSIMERARKLKKEMEA